MLDNFSHNDTISGITVMQCYVFTAFWSCGRILITWHCSTIIFIYRLRGRVLPCWNSKQSYSFPLSVHCCT